jgi:hypothetical protein
MVSGSAALTMQAGRGASRRSIIVYSLRTDAASRDSTHRPAGTYRPTGEPALANRGPGDQGPLMSPLREHPRGVEDDVDGARAPATAPSARRDRRDRVPNRHGPVTSAREPRDVATSRSNGPVSGSPIRCSMRSEPSTEECPPHRFTSVGECKPEPGVPETVRNSTYRESSDLYHYTATPRFAVP